VHPTTAAQATLKIHLQRYIHVRCCTVHSRVGNLKWRRTIKFLLHVLAANFPLSESFWTSRNHLSVQGALSQYRLHIVMPGLEGKMRNVKLDMSMTSSWHSSRKAQPESSLLMLTPCFDVTTGGCASETNTPYISDLYEALEPSKVKS
jgi:hypothetical protein